MRSTRNRVLAAYLLAAVAAGALALAAVPRSFAREPWAPLLVLPWALFLGGAVPSALLAPRLAPGARPWERVGAVSLAAFALALPAITLARDVAHAFDAAFVTPRPGSFVMNAVLLAAGAGAFALAWRRARGGGERRVLAGALVAIAVAFVVPRLGPLVLLALALAHAAVLRAFTGFRPGARRVGAAVGAALVAGAAAFAVVLLLIGGVFPLDAPGVTQGVGVAFAVAIAWALIAGVTALLLVRDATRHVHTRPAR